jgi:YD repeat-containing protein
LRAVITPSSEANIYEYDAAGNVTAIRRNTATTLEVLDFHPREGVSGMQQSALNTFSANPFGASVVIRSIAVLSDFAQY